MTAPSRSFSPLRRGVRIEPTSEGQGESSLACGGYSQCDFELFFKKYLPMYLAAPGLSCSLQDLPSSLQHAGTFSGMRTLGRGMQLQHAVAACGI